MGEVAEFVFHFATTGLSEEKAEKLMEAIVEWVETHTEGFVGGGFCTQEQWEADDAP